jgi:hypothetical protein
VIEQLHLAATTGGRAFISMSFVDFGLSEPSMLIIVGEGWGKSLA